MPEFPPRTRKVQRLKAFAREQGWMEFDEVSEIEKRKELLRDPEVSRIVVEHRDRLARFGFEMIEAALLASGRRIVLVEEGEATDDLVT